MANGSPDNVWSRYRREQADAIIATLESDQDDPDLTRKLIQKCKLVLDNIGGQDEWWRLSADTQPRPADADERQSGAIKIQRLGDPVALEVIGDTERRVGSDLYLGVPGIEVMG